MSGVEKVKSADLKTVANFLLDRLRDSDQKELDRWKNYGASDIEKNVYQAYRLGVQGAAHDILLIAAGLEHPIHEDITPEHVKIRKLTHFPMEES